MPQYLTIIITPDGSQAKTFNNVQDAQDLINTHLDADGLIPDGVAADYVRVSKSDGIFYAICYADADGYIHHIVDTSIKGYAIAYADGFVRCYNYMVADGLDDNDHIETMVVEVHPDGQARIIA